jgi:hypothetical protein
VFFSSALSFPILLHCGNGYLVVFEEKWFIIRVLFIHPICRSFLTIGLSTALLQNPPFQLDYSPSSSESDCIGPQRAFSTSAAFPTDDDEQNRRIGSLGHSLSQPGATPATNSFRFNTQNSALQDVQ